MFPQLTLKPCLGGGAFGLSPSAPEIKWLLYKLPDPQISDSLIPVSSK
jgi:hypothetical protein